MRPFSLPVRSIGPATSSDDEPLQVLDIPHEILAFEMPRVPEHASGHALRDARDSLARFGELLAAWDRSISGANPRLDLFGLPPDTRAVLNEVLGEGEVAVQVSGKQAWRIQESVFTGLWRVCAVERDGSLGADWLEAASLPEIALSAARAAASPHVLPIAMPAGAMNSPALLHELAAHVAQSRDGSSRHVLNLTLLPLTPEDHRVLERALPVGPVAMISRGFGNCRVTSTAVRDVWRVQYFNSMNTLILNTIEITIAPEVVVAADEDLVDTRGRLAELVDWMSASCES